MSKSIKTNIKEGLKNSNPKGLKPEKLTAFNLKTSHKNQFLTFFKPENFLEKTLDQTEKIIDLVFEKFDKYGISIDGASIFPGPSLAKYEVMDRHYGVINQLSKSASKILSTDQKNLVHDMLKVSGKNLKILGGHEAFEISGFKSTEEFDRYWLELPSTKIKSGFYARTMKINQEDTIIINGFHPHQLAHYTGVGRKLGVLLISSDTSWKIIREEMLGETFPEKAHPESIRGTLYRKAKDFGFQAVTIANNILHISAGPTEALFEIDNFLREPFGVDVIKDGALLSRLLLKEGFTPEEIKALLTDKTLHGELEHKDTKEAIAHIKSKKR